MGTRFTILFLGALAAGCHSTPVDPGGPLPPLALDVEGLVITGGFEALENRDQLFRTWVNIRNSTDAPLSPVLRTGHCEIIHRVLEADNSNVRTLANMPEGLCDDIGTLLELAPGESVRRTATLEFGSLGLKSRAAGGSLYLALMIQLEGTEATVLAGPLAGS